MKCNQGEYTKNKNIKTIKSHIVKKKKKDIILNKKKKKK